MDVEQYLRRIRYQGSTQITAATLRDLHRQHLFTVPFENLDIALCTPIRLDLESLFNKIVVHQRGGFCYELNGLLCELLRALGFRVHMLSARVRHADGAYGPEFDHMLLKVDLEEPWLADVGFGESFVDPMPLRSGATTNKSGQSYSVRHDGGQWQLVKHQENGESPQYIFFDAPHTLSEYEGMCNYHQYSPESHFTKSRVCSLATPDGRVTLSGMRLIVTRKGQREESTLRDEAELRHCLQHRFGVEFDNATDLTKLTL
jgi:N-hydroxyarylamine O-acetyltransferase